MRKLPVVSLMVVSCVFAGVGRLESVERARESEQAASRIQAAYRGHQVRRSVQEWIKEPTPEIVSLLKFIRKYELIP